MAKLKSGERSSETPLERTARLARKLIAVPKAEVDKAKAREIRAKAKL